MERSVNNLKCLPLIPTLQKDAGRPADTSIPIPAYQAQGVGRKFKLPAQLQDTKGEKVQDGRTYNPKVMSYIREEWIKKKMKDRYTKNKRIILKGVVSDTVFAAVAGFCNNSRRRHRHRDRARPSRNKGNQTTPQRKLCVSMSSHGTLMARSQNPKMILLSGSRAHAMVGLCQKFLQLGKKDAIESETSCCTYVLLVLVLVLVQCVQFPRNGGPIGCKCGK
jgi:hypothetical protein